MKDYQLNLLQDLLLSQSGPAGAQIAQRSGRTLVGVDVEERSKSIGYNHALENGLAFPQLYDPDGRSTNYFGPGVPITQFINKEGVLTFQKVGPIFTYEEMQELVKEYLEIDIG
jgi:hypothetical protein